MSNFSILQQQFDERERKLIEEAAFGKGLKSLPDNWDRSRTKRIAKAEKDFFFFAKEYFPQWFTFEFCDEHRQLIGFALSNDRKIHLCGAPRDFGKTRIFRVFKVWCACFGIKRHYSKASDTLDLVEKDFRYVRDIIKFNPKIVSDFGAIIDETWDSLHSFRIKPHKHNPTGTTFVANSTTVTPRGELGETRVDFIEFDDFEDYATSINADQSLFKIDVIERDFHQALTDNGCAVYLGNNARTTCVMNVLAEMSDVDRAAKHPAFVIHLIDAWDESHKRPTWHQRYDFASEDEMRESLGVSKNVWSAEFRQKPSPPEGTRFLLAHFITYDTTPRDARGIVMCDPAFGETSDFKAGVIVLYSPSLKKFLAPECFVRRCGWKNYFEWMYDVYERWQSKLLWIGWESNFAQAQYLEFRKLYPSTRNKPDLPIRKILVEGDKFFRIEQLETPYANGSILFHKDFLRTPDGVEAQSQLIGYIGKKNAKHRVDFPDCLATAYAQMFRIAATLGTETDSIIVGGRRNTADELYPRR